MRALSYIILLGGQGLFVALLSGCPKSESAATNTDASSTPVTSASQVNLAPLDTGTPAASASTTTPTTPVATLGGAGAPPVVPSGILAKALDAGIPIPTTTTTTTATASATPAAQAHFKQCCSALHKQSQQQTPQAAQFAQAATMCDGLAAAMATAPQMPQMDQVKMLLQGVQLPPVCQGL